MNIILVGALLLASHVSYASSVPAEHISTENAALQKEIDKKCVSGSVITEVSCIEKLQTEYQREGKFRGTTEYAATHYKAMDDNALYTLLGELIKLRKTARESGHMDNVDGELTKENYDLEINWIVKKLRDNGFVPPDSKPLDPRIRIIR
jgi:hypothetical protein